MHIERPLYHGRSFEGNQCDKLLDNIDVLQRMIDSSDPATYFATLPYIRAFRAFNAVKQSCFGDKLHSNFNTCIDDFRTAYLDLGINVTTKVHMIFCEVPRFCEARGRGLSLFSEQSTESVHSDFKKVWKGYKVTMNNPNFGENLLSGTVAYNSRHM